MIISVKQINVHQESVSSTALGYSQHLLNELCPPFPVLAVWHFSNQQVIPPRSLKFPVKKKQWKCTGSLGQGQVLHQRDDRMTRTSVTPKEGISRTTGPPPSSHLTRHTPVSELSEKEIQLDLWRKEQCSGQCKPRWEAVRGFWVRWIFPFIGRLVPTVTITITTLRSSAELVITSQAALCAGQ